MIEPNLERVVISTQDAEYKILTPTHLKNIYWSLMISGDVCDDREQLAAIFDEQNGGHYHGGGDGMSSASDSDTKEGGATTSSENLLQV